MTEIPLVTNLQAVAVQLIFPFKLTICNLYLPDFNWSKPDLENLISQIPTPFLVVGDFNAHHPAWGSDHADARGRIVEDVLNDLDLVLLNTGEMTYFNSRANSFSAIDLAFCSPQISDRLQWTTVKDYLPSDHIPITINISEAFITHESLTKWKLEKANWCKFRENLPQLDYFDDTNSNLLNMITSAVLRSAETSIPKSGGTCHRSKVPWWNAEIETAIRNKKRALNKFKRNPTETNKIEFKRARAIARRTILTSKRKSWQTYVSSINISTPASEVWQKIRAIRGKKFPHVTPILDVNGHITSDTLEVAEALADHFSQMEEFDNALKEAKKTSPGNDSIPYEIIRQLPTSYKEYLLWLFNKIWQDGIYPDQWKQVLIIPLLKEGKNPKLTSSYRPVSLTCCIGKIMEKMVSNRLIWYLETNNLLSESQMGFRKNRSTIDNLVHLESIIQGSFANRNHTVAIFFDLEKAFDMVWRFGILKSLYKWGLRGNLPLFVQSFLDNRSFRVRLGNTLSQPQPLENGVSQGSTLSVILFAISINDLLSDLNHSVGRMLYVDDLALYYSAESMDDIENKLQVAINALCDSTHRIGFRFSSSKTHFVHFCRLRREHGHPNLTLYGQTLECKTETKFLGVKFDHKLYWGAHIQNLADRCKKDLNILKCLAGFQWGADRETLLIIYRTLILAKMDYACIVYSSARKTRLKMLDSIHHTGLRLALGAFRTSPSASLCCEGGIPPLKYRRQQFLVSYGAAIWAQPGHPNYEVLFGEDSLLPYNGRPTISRPVGVRLHELMDTFDETFPQTYNIGYCEIPPWKLSLPKIVLKHSIHRKDETNKQELLSDFYTSVTSFQGYHKLYTDGSKLDQGVGCAFSDEINTYNWTLPKIASVYTAELYAIWQALRYAEMNEVNDILICTDSLSSLQGLSNPFATDPLVQCILALINCLRDSDKRIAFVWTPSHVGIHGNELADKAAKQAAGYDTQDNILIRKEDIKSYFKLKILDMWQSEWNNTNSKLKEVKPKICKWKINHSFRRREECVIARLRIGHTNLTNVYLLTGNHQPVCQNCNVILTVKHIILECSNYDRYRTMLKIPGQLRLCVGESIRNLEKIIKFLKITNLFKKL